MRYNIRNQMFFSFLRDKNRKNVFKIIKELIILFFHKRALPTHYLTNLLYRKNISNYKDYLTFAESLKLLFYSIGHAPEQIDLVTNKFSAEEFLRENNIATTQTLFQNSKNKFLYNDEIFIIETKKDFFSFLNKVFSDVNIEKVFCKPIDGMKGQNVFILDRKTLYDTTDDLFDLVFSEAFIFQKLIVQHESLNKINNSSINTLRVVSYKNKSNEVEILSGFIRLGRKGAIVDNAHKGGIVVPFNKDTGRMGYEGLQLIDKGGGVFYEHPDTGIVFDNFEIPHYNEVKEMVIKASSLFNFPLLGWDVSITSKGPIIVEINHNFDLYLSDRMDRGLKNIPSFNEFLINYNKL